MSETIQPRLQEKQSSGVSEKYEQVMSASPDVVIAAVQSEVERLRNLLSSDNNLNTHQRADALQQVRKLGGVDSYARAWQRESARRNDPEQTFLKFIDQEIDTAIEVDEDKETMGKLVNVQSWVGSEVYQRLVGNMLDIAAESETGSVQEHVSVESPLIDTSVENPANNAEVAARRSIESLYESSDLFESIAALTKGQTAIHVDARGGLQFVGDVDKQLANELAVIPQDLQKEQSKIGFSEAVVFTELQRLKQREVDVQVGWQKKGMFGKQVPKMGTKLEDIPGSEAPVLITNPTNGQQESAVRFRYKFEYDNLAMKLRYEGALPRYKGFNDSRDGAHVLLGVDLPKSIADELQRQVADDPSTARKLVERLVLTNNNGNITKEYWEAGIGNGRIKPPYEELPDDWTVAVVTGSEARQYHRPVVLDYTISRLTTAVKF